MYNNPFGMGFEPVEPAEIAKCPHCGGTAFIIQEATVYNAVQSAENPQEIEVSKIKVSELDWICCEECSENITEQLAHLLINFP